MWSLGGPCSQHPNGSLSHYSLQHKIVKYFLLKWSHNTLVQLAPTLCCASLRVPAATEMYFRILGSRYQLLTRSGLRDSRWWNDETETARDTQARSRGCHAARHDCVTGAGAGCVTHQRARTQCCEDLHFLPPRPLPIPRYQPGDPRLVPERNIYCVSWSPAPVSPSITCSCRMWAPCLIISRRKVLSKNHDDK